MKKQTLGGTIISYNCISQDYCLIESIRSLIDLCDQVIVLDCGSTDGTAQMLMDAPEVLGNPNIKVIYCDNKEWQTHRGHEKLSYFTNRAIQYLETDWHFCLQADEAPHEDCFDVIRNAIESDHDEAFMVRRINLWRDAGHYLKVSPDRMPVSDYIIRLAKSCYKSFGDAESLMAQCSQRYAEDIRIYHMGFIRKAEVHPAKIRHMQKEVFEIEPDPKLKGMDVFDPYAWFSDEDLQPIWEPLPKYIQEWARVRP